jgi:peptide/nickel transport system permease protein
VRLLSAAAVGAGALPEFLVAMLAIAYLASRWRLFPPGGGLTPFAGQHGLGSLAVDIAWHAALPGLTLVIGLVPPFALLVRNAVVPVLGERYLVTARPRSTAPRVAWHAPQRVAAVTTLLGLSSAPQWPVPLS